MSILEKLSEIRPDLSPDYIKKCLINEVNYFSINKNICTNGLSAVEHYFEYGYKNSEIKVGETEVFLNKPIFDFKKNHTLFFSNAGSNDGSFIYRCKFQSKIYKNSLVYDGNTDIKKLVLSIFNSERLIFSRPEYNDLSKYIIHLAKNIGVKVTFDYDDLLLPEFSEYLGHVRSSIGSNLESSRSSAIKRAALMYYAEDFICSTPEIEYFLSNFGKPTVVRKNKIDRSLIGSPSKSAMKLKNIENRKIKIIYLSGTATHKKDFSIIQAPLLKIMQNYGDKIELTFLGNTAVNPKIYEIYGVKVNLISRVSFEEMLEVISWHDLALVPLEETVFNDAKSNIKFIECGSQGVPVMASTVKEYVSTINNGKNGWLCKNQNDWYEILKLIINNPKCLYIASIAARVDVLKNYSL